MALSCRGPTRSEPTRLPVSASHSRRTQSLVCFGSAWLNTAANSFPSGLSATLCPRRGFCPRSMGEPTGFPVAASYTWTRYGDRPAFFASSSSWGETFGFQAARRWPSLPATRSRTRPSRAGSQTFGVPGGLAITLSRANAAAWSGDQAPTGVASTGRPAAALALPGCQGDAPAVYLLPGRVGVGLQRSDGVRGGRSRVVRFQGGDTLGHRRLHRVGAVVGRRILLRLARRLLRDDRRRGRRGPRPPVVDARRPSVSLARSRPSGLARTSPGGDWRRESTCRRG